MESILAVMIFFELVLVSVAAWLACSELNRQKIEKEKQKNRKEMNYTGILNDFEGRG